jgi:hypothetical protein
MLMKRKNIFYTVLAVTLLLTAAFLTNCLNPMEGGTIPGNDTVTIAPPPSGMGAILVSVVEDEARKTIAPENGTLTALKYLVVVSEGAYDATAETGIPAKANISTIVDDGVTIKQGSSYGYLISTPIYLTPAATGTKYTVTVFAYDAATGNTTLILAGKEEVTLSPGDSEGVEIKLIGVNTGTTVGTFEYTITFPPLSADQPDNVNMIVTTMAGTAPAPGGAVSVDTDETLGPNSISMNPGYYRVTFLTTAEDYDDDYVSLLLHIYPTLTSSYEFEVPSVRKMVKEDLKIVVYFDPTMVLTVPPPTNITGTAPGETVVGAIHEVTTRAGSTTLAIRKGDLIDNPGPAVPAVAEYMFTGWYKVADEASQNASTLWYFNQNAVLGDMTLYAGYSKDMSSVDNITVTIGVNDFNTENPDEIVVLKRSQYAEATSGGVGYTYTIAGASESSWRLGGQVVGTTNSFTFENNANAIGKHIPGPVVYTLETKIDGIWYSINFTVYLDNGQ